MSFLVKKEKGKLIINCMGGYETRNPSTIWCVEQADKIYNWPNFKEIKILTRDYETLDNQYTFSKQKSFNCLVPDFNFHSWPQVGVNDYTETTQQISEYGKKPYKVNKVGWIGNINTNKYRGRLLELGTENPDIFDVYSMEWKRNTGQTFLEGSKYISLPELVETYSLLIDIEGYGYSGRLKYLLWSHRPVLLVDRPHKEYFFEHLKEWVHFVPVKQDLSDLIEKTKWCIENEEKAKEIAENAYEFSKKYLTREACYEQWNKIIQEISK